MIDMGVDCRCLFETAGLAKTAGGSDDKLAKLESVYFTVGRVLLYGREHGAGVGGGRTSSPASSGQHGTPGTFLRRLGWQRQRAAAMTTSPTLKPCRADTPSRSVNTVPKSLEDVLPVSRAPADHKHPPGSNNKDDGSDRDGGGRGSGEKDALPVTCIL